MSTFSLPLDLSSYFPHSKWVFEDRLPKLPIDQVYALINKWAPLGSFSQDYESESPRYKLPGDSGNDDTIYGCELKENWLREYYDSHEVLQQYRFSAVSNKNVVSVDEIIVHLRYQTGMRMLQYACVRDSDTKACRLVLVLNDLTWPVVPNYSQAQVSEIIKSAGNAPRWWGPIYRWEF
ncbi:hypothetical protein BDW22DRAFT_1196968 [Trametopsis cervina]|nr:hypothetical protein BDW22DRAFT_1196968 [Trametopsis cervina]